MAEKYYLWILGKRDTIVAVSAIYGVSPSAEAWCEIVSGLFLLSPDAWSLLEEMTCT